MGTSSLLRLIVIVALLALASYRVAASDFNIGALGDEKSVPRFTYDRHLLGMKVEYLHRINVGDIEGLRSELQEWMVWDCLAIWELVQKDGLLSSKEREQAYDQLRLVAIQHEKYPVAKWNENEQLQRIFKTAIEDNPQRAESLRAKNWKRPMWLP